MLGCDCKVSIGNVSSGIASNQQSSKSVSLKKLYGVAALIVTLLLLSGCGAAAQKTSKNPSSTPEIATAQPPASAQGVSTALSGNLSLFSSQEYHVSLQYPSAWEQSSLYSVPMYEGSDGFFEIAAMDGAGVAIDQAAEIDAHHVLKPFGANPSIETLEIAGQEARLIKPSDDQQQASQKNLSELIVRYPEVVQIGGNNYCYFILWSDKSHIDLIAKTIKFLN
jgi:TolB protein